MFPKNLFQMIFKQRVADSGLAPVLDATLAQKYVMVVPFK